MCILFVCGLLIELLGFLAALCEMQLLQVCLGMSQTCVCKELRFEIEASRLWTRPDTPQNFDAI